MPREGTWRRFIEDGSEELEDEGWVQGWSLLPRARDSALRFFRRFRVEGLCGVASTVYQNRALSSLLLLAEFEQSEFSPWMVTMFIGTPPPQLKEVSKERGSAVVAVGESMFVLKEEKFDVQGDESEPKQLELTELDGVSGWLLLLSRLELAWVLDAESGVDSCDRFSWMPDSSKFGSAVVVISGRRVWYEFDNPWWAS